MLYTYINILNRIFTETQGVQKQLDQCLQINLKKRQKWKPFNFIQSPLI